MTNPTPHGQVPEALRLAEEISNLMCSSEAAAKTIAAAADELCRLHVENASLRASPAASPTPPVEQQNGWREAAVAWEVCASLHRQYCKGKDALFTTRQSDFVKHAENARVRANRGQAPATQQAGDVVAYLDVGAGGYLDLGSALSDEDLQQLPKGRHALVIAGTYGIDGYVAAPQQEAQEPTTVDKKTMELAESVGLIGPASRVGDLHAAIQRFHDLICVNATIKAAVMAAEAIGKQQAAPQQEAQEPTEIPEEIERMAADRYKVVPSHESMFHRWAVVAGTGTQQLYLGREVECQNMARKFAGAFLDGAFVTMQSTSPNPAPAPLSDDVVKDAARWHWLAEYLVGTRTYLDDEIMASKTVNDLRKLVEAAIKQGGKA